MKSMSVDRRSGCSPFVTARGERLSRPILAEAGHSSLRDLALVDPGIVLNDLASQLSKIRRLTNVRLYVLKPAARIGTVYDAPQVAQTFGHIAPVIENVFLGCPRIICEEHSHSFRFGEDIGRVTELGSLNDHAVL